MKPSLLLILFFLFSTVLVAQDDMRAYIEYTRIADSLFIGKEYPKAVKLYSAAFEAKGGQGKVKDRYKAASCWAILNNIDSAFWQLNRIAFRGRYLNVEEISKDSSFATLHNDKRWAAIIEQIKKNKTDFEEAPIIQ